MLSHGIALCLLSGWFSGEVGSGVIKEEPRQVAEFHRVRVETGLEADVSIGPKSVVVAGDDNLLAFVKTEVENGELVIRARSPNGYTSKVGLKVRVTTPSLEGIAALSGATLRLNAMTGDSLGVRASAGADVRASKLVLSTVNVDVSAGARAELSGKTKDVHARCSGGADLRAGELSAADVMIEAGGGASVVVNASERLEGDVSSGANLSVRGKPRVHHVETSSGASYDFEGSREL